MRINGAAKTNVQFDIYWFRGSPRRRALLLHPWEQTHLAGINFVTNKLKSRRRFQRFKWISVIYEELPARLPDGSSIDRKCSTIEIKKKLDADIGSIGIADERKQDKMKKASKYTRRTKRTAAVIFSAIAEITGQTYSRNWNRIKKLAKPIKTFCESSRDSPSGRTVGFRGVFFLPPLRRLPSGRRIGRH